MIRVTGFDLDGTVARRDTFVPFLCRVLWRRPSRWWRVIILGAAVTAYSISARLDNGWLKRVFIRQILGGDTRDSVQHIVRRHIAAIRDNGLSPAVRKALSTALRDGPVLFVTASPDLYVGELAHELGVEDVICTRLETGPNGRFTGILAGGNCHGEEKCRRLGAWLGAHGVDWTEVRFYSDSHADLPVLQQAGEPVLVNPTGRLKAAMPLAKVLVD